MESPMKQQQGKLFVITAAVKLPRFDDNAYLSSGSL
jgi:hypothetical protein